MSIPVSVIGEFVDAKAGTSRTVGAVAGRLIEETVELGLAAGLTSAQILAHVADALHNQALKASSPQKTVFPSQLQGDINELAEECADVQLVLKDLCHVGEVGMDAAEAEKWEKFTQKEFRVSDSGTLYSVKPHVN